MPTVDWAAATETLGRISREQFGQIADTVFANGYVRTIARPIRTETDVREVLEHAW